MLTILRPQSIPETRLNRIYAYTDADMSDIEKIVNQWVYDCGESGSGRKRGNRYKKKEDEKKVSNDFFTFDIETTSLYDNAMDKHYSMPYLYQFFIANRCFLLRERENAVRVFEIVENTAKDLNRIIPCYIHNLSFEYQHLHKDWKKITDDFKVFATEKRNILRVTTSAIEYRCSYRLTNMSLAKMCESYNTADYQKDKELIDYEIKRYPWSELDNEIYYYSAMDVIALYRAIENLMKKDNDNLKSIPMTATGYVRRACRNAMLKDNDKRTNDKNQKYIYSLNQITRECYDVMKMAFRGGNTHANRYYTGTILENVHSYDFASSYPAIVMCSNEFPVSPLVDATEDFKNYDSEKFTYMINELFTVMTVKLTDCRIRDDKYVPVPYIPVSKMVKVDKLENLFTDNGRLLSVDGSFYFSFCGIEFNTIKNQYTFDMEIVKVYTARKGYLPFELRFKCSEWYKNKTTLKGVEGQEYFYMKSKNLLNAIYGMMVEAYVRDIVEYDETTELINQRKPTIEESEKQISDKISKSKNFICYQWGILITAVARIRLQQMIEIAGKDFVYCDTDSCKMLNFDDEKKAKFDAFNKEWIEFAENNGDGKKVNIREYTIKGKEQIIGIADYEGCYQQFKTLGAKKYCVVENGKLECTIAGVPKKMGAKMLGSIDNFKIGFTFIVHDNDTIENRQAWKKILYYNDDCFSTKVDGRETEIFPGIAMERTTYVLSITEEYAELLGECNKEMQESVF